MTHSVTRIIRAIGSSLAVLLLAISAPAIMAQDEGAGLTRLTQRLVVVHADKTGEYTELMKERSVAEEAAGIGFRHVYQRLRGQTNGFLIISPAGGGGLPEVDLPDDWGSRISSTVVSRTVFTSTIGPGTTQLESVKPPTEYMFVRVRTVMPGKSAAYADWQENKLMPALREAGVGDVRSTRILLGGNPRTFVRYSFVDDWPEFNPPDDALMSVLAEGEAMVAAPLNVFYRYRDDLSFTAE